MSTPPVDRYAVDRFREECHFDDEGYLHTGSSDAHVDRIIIKRTDNIGSR